MTDKKHIPDVMTFMHMFYDEIFAADYETWKIHQMEAYLKKLEKDPDLTWKRIVTGDWTLEPKD
jgi:hypothetical protein